MLLVTLGYNAEKAGLVGINWASKTNALADENGLLEDVNTSFTAACPRQYAAQIIYNAIDTPTVVWRDDAYTNVNVLGKDNQTVGEKYMNLVKDEAEVGEHDNILTKVEKEDGRDTYTITVGGTVYTRVVADYSDLMGQDVVVMHKKNDTSKVFGVYAAEDSKVLATGIIGDMEKVSGNDKKVKIDGTEYKLEGKRDETKVYNFNSDVAAKAITVNSYVNTKADALAANVAANTIKLVDNDGNGKADRVVIVPRSVNEVTYVGSSNFSLQNKGTIKFKDCESVYEGIAKDDYALYTDGDYTASGDHNVAKVEIVSGEVKGTKGAKGEYQVRVGDKWYYLASGVDQLESGSSYDLAVVGGVVFNADETEASSKDIVALVDIDTSNNRIDGKSIADDAVIFAIYDKNGGKDIEVKVLSGKTVNNWDKEYKGSVVYGSKEENGISYVKVAAIKASAKYTGMGSDYNYGYLTATPYTTTENPDGSTDKCTAFDIWNGTENVTVYNDGVYNGTNAMTGKAYKTGDILIYTLDGKYISVESGAGDIVATKAAVYGFDYKAKGNIEFKAADGTVGAYKLDDDCVFLAVNDDDNKGVGNDMNQLIKAQPDNKGGYVQNAWVIYNNDSDHDVVAVIFDVENNEWLS